jgi:hypothetical protein
MVSPLPPAPPSLLSRGVEVFDVNGVGFLCMCRGVINSVLNTVYSS